MSNNLIKVAIADDHVLVRKAIANYLSQQTNLMITLQADNASTLIDNLHHFNPDVILIDYFMPKMNTIDAINYIIKTFPDMKIVVLSLCTDLQIISTLLELGIHAFLAKTDEPVNLLQAIRSVSEGRIHRNPLYMEALFINKEADIKRKKNNVIILNDREKQVIQFLWAEMTNEEITKHVYLSIRSVEKIRQELKEKIGYKSIAGLFKYSLDQGIISIGKVGPSTVTASW